MKTSTVLEKLVQRAASVLGHARTTRGKDGNEITIEPETEESIKCFLLRYAGDYLDLTGKKEKVGRERNLADFDCTETSLESVVNEIKAAAKHIERLNNSLFVKTRRTLAEAQGDEGINRFLYTYSLPESLRDYADLIKEGIDEGKDSPFRTKQRDDAKYQLIYWAGTANYALLSQFLEEMAQSKGIKLTDPQRAAIGEEALRKFADRHGLTAQKKNEVNAGNQEVPEG